MVSYNLNDILKHDNEFGQSSYKNAESHEKIRIITIFPIDLKKDGVIFLNPKNRLSRFCVFLTYFKNK